jgi:integrase
MARGTIVTRTTKSGEKRYHAAWWTERPDCTRKQVWRTFQLKRDAEAFLDEHSKLVREGDYIEPSRMTFEQFSKEWLEKYPRLAEKPLKDSSITAYHHVIQKHLIPFFGDKRLTSIKASTIEKDFKASLAMGRTPKTQRNVLLVLRVMLETAVQWDYLRVNPFHLRNKVKLPARNEEQKERALRPDEIRKLFDVCLENTYAIVATAVLTGMRRSEIFGLRWEDVDFDKNQIHVRQALYWKKGSYWKGRTGFEFTTPKSKMSVRNIDLSPTLRRILLEHKLRCVKSELGLVFLNPAGQPVSPDEFVRVHFNSAILKTGLGKVRFHDLRHTFGSLKIEQGENIKYVQTQMGHSSIKVTLDVYGHLLKDSNPEAAARTDALVFGNQSAKASS